MNNKCNVANCDVIEACECNKSVQRNKRIMNESGFWIDFDERRKRRKRK